MTTAESGFAQPADEFDTEVLPIRRRPRLSALTALLTLCAVAGAAFAGGVEVQKHHGGSSSGNSATAGGGASGRAAAFARFRSGSGGGGSGFFGARGGGFPGAAGNATAGLVTLIKGSTLYVTDLTGNTVKVTTARGLTVTKTVTSSVRSIHPGDSVVVRGSKQKDGSYKATSVTLTSN